MFTKVCAALAVLVVSTAGTIAHAQSYRLNQPLADDPDTILQEVAITPERTTVTIVLRNSSKRDTIEACAHPSHKPEAFMLKDLDSGKVWKQEGSTGLVSCENGMDEIRPGKRKTLKVQVPSLPVTARRLQIGENNCQQKPDDGMDYWCFSEVVLNQKK